MSSKVETQRINQIKAFLENQFPPRANTDKYIFLISMALRASISSSTRNNTLYKPGYNKNKVHLLWERKLLEYSSKQYSTLLDYATSVDQMKEDLNQIAGEEATFTLAHSQKSLSLFLKYLWIYSMIKRPIACPIDRSILNKAKEKDPSIKISNWTELDNINTYKQILYALKEWANPTSLADKELNYWNMY